MRGVVNDWIARIVFFSFLASLPWTWQILAGLSAVAVCGLCLVAPIWMVMSTIAEDDQFPAWPAIGAAALVILAFVR